METSGAREIIASVDVASITGVFVSGGAFQTITVRTSFTYSRDRVRVEAFSGAGSNAC